MFAQIFATIIFIAMFILIILETFEKHYVTLIAGALTLVIVFGLCFTFETPKEAAAQTQESVAENAAESAATQPQLKGGARAWKAIMETLNIKCFITKDFWHVSGHSGEESSGINWATILFIAGMMVMVEGMAHSGFFRWLCMLLAKSVNYRPMALFIAFMIMSAVLSMFIDSITVILFLAAVTVELSKLLKFNPIPMILSEIFCANLGGSATMCGDPPNIIVGTALHYTFFDFLTNTGIIAAIGLALIVLYFCIVFYKDFKNVKISEQSIAGMPKPSSAIVNVKDFVISCIIFGCAIVLLITHANTGLTVAFIGVFIAVITLLTSGKNALKLLKKVDYKTLLFFIGLFVVVGGLEQTGILEVIAGLIGKLSGDNIYIMVAIILWLSAIASAIIDNIPFSATMVPVIKALSAATGADLATLAWTLSIGTDIGGSATPIGASANVVGVSVAQKNGYIIGWGKYCKYMLPATLIIITISMVLIFVRYC